MTRPAKADAAAHASAAPRQPDLFETAAPEATRAAGLARLQAFRPRMGKRYASGRNHDHGPGGHKAVSLLSPYTRRRLVTEEELARAAIEDHGLEGAEKFVQEVFWRGYFKGWLERRPQVWAAYRAGLDDDLGDLAADRRLRKTYDAAVEGRTGLDCFDAWAGELAETGYLHNHARMWFASIWIFTFDLPWRLGADFFYRHLLDGDPASNTCSWRWVAGLHTRGKTYQAQAWNIAKFTGGRFTPRQADLAPDAPALTGEEPGGLPDLRPLRMPAAPMPDVPTGLLITEEDCRPEDFPLGGLDLRAAATLAASHLRSPLGAAPPVRAFEDAALADAAARAGAATGLAPTRLTACDPADLVAWARDHGLRQIATAYIPQGPLRDWLDAAAPAFAAAGLSLTEWRRPWDAAIWPHATAGFFKVKKQIPRILADLEAP